MSAMISLSREVEIMLSGYNYNNYNPSTLVVIFKIMVGHNVHMQY